MTSKDLLIFPLLIIRVHGTLRASLVAQTVENPPAIQDIWIQSLGREDPLRRDWLPTPVFLPGELHGQRRLGGFSPWGCKESDTTERLIHTHKQTWSTVPYKDGFRQSLPTYAVRCVKGTHGRNICKLSLSTFFQWFYQDMFLDQQSLPFSTCRHHLRV